MVAEHQRVALSADTVVDLAPRAVLVIGVQGAGKSAVGRLLAERCRRGAFIEGDVLWKMVVGGRVDMAATPDAEAERQLALRYAHGALLAASFVTAGFVAVHADNVYGPAVAEQLARFPVPRSLVVLRPRPDVVERRERERGTDAYAPWTAQLGSRQAAIEQFDRWLAESPAVGLWLDTSDLTVDETVEHILERWPETFIE